MDDLAIGLFDLKWYLRQLPVKSGLSLQAALADYRSSGEAGGRTPHPLFCPKWYGARLEKEGLRSRVGSQTLLDHYLKSGPDGLDPNPFFDHQWYHQQYLAGSKGENALNHYIAQGHAAGNLPSMHFTVDVVRAHFSDRGDSSPSALERWMKKFYWVPAKEEQEPCREAAKQRDGSFFSRLFELWGRRLEAEEQRDVLRVLFISGDPHSASHVYRVDNVVSALRLGGHVADWIARQDITESYRVLSNYDLLVIFRCEMDVHLGLLMATARRAKVQMIFDIDDLNFLPELAKVESMDVLRFFEDGEALFRKRFANMAETLRTADFASSPTAFLCRQQEKVSGRKSFHIPNGYPAEVLAKAEQILEEVSPEASDDLVRLGYAAGTKTHQRDFGVIAAVLQRILQKYRHVRLVLFRDKQGAPLVDLEELDASWGPLLGSVEWRPFCPIHDMVVEMARFDINLAPLEANQPRCEAKSELKFFEAALVQVPTVASPTEPFREAMEDGVTGFLASDEEGWEVKLVRLIEDDQLRRDIGRRARHEVLEKHGPQRRRHLLEIAYREVLSQSRDGR